MSDLVDPDGRRTQVEIEVREQVEARGENEQQVGECCQGSIG